MWTSFVENPESIQAIYGNEPPLLDDIYLHEINFINGADLQCNLKFDLAKMPPHPPEKWIHRNVNTVQVHLNLANAAVISFAYDGSRLKGNLQLIVEKDWKKLVYSIYQREILIVKARAVHISGVIGYTRE